MTTPVLEATALTKRYLGGDGGTIEVLRGLDLAVASGEFVAITGESGSGKSTLLHLLGALDAPSSGQVLLDGMASGARPGMSVGWGAGSTGTLEIKNGAELWKIVDPCPEEW